MRKRFFTSADEYAKIIDHFLSIYYGWGVCLFIALVDVFSGKNIFRIFFMDGGIIGEGCGCIHRRLRLLIFKLY